MRLILARCGIVLLVICLVDCSAWHATQVPLTELEGENIRITTSSSEKREGTLMVADSLGVAVLQPVTEWKSRYSVLAKPKPLTFDTTTIAGVEIRVFSAGRTAAMVLIPIALGLGLLAIAAPSLGD